jgi:hypothetical protein
MIFRYFLLLADEDIFSIFNKLNQKKIVFTYFNFIKVIDIDRIIIIINHCC